MNTLSDKSRTNLKIIKSMSDTSILSSSSSREITIQEEFIEVDNINNLENGLYFTFHQCLSDMANMTFIEKDILFGDLDECIQNIYDNKSLNNLMKENTELYEIMNDIDVKTDLLKESYFYNSPFYNYYCKFCLMKEYLNGIVENPPCYSIVKFLKEYNEYNIKLNKSVVTCSDEGLDTDSDSNSDSDSDSGNKEE